MNFVPKSQDRLTDNGAVRILAPTAGSGANRKFKLAHYQAETPMQIRTARAADEVQWRELWRGYTEFCETHPPENVTAATWRRIVAPEPRDSVPVRRARGPALGISHSPPREATFL